MLLAATLGMVLGGAVAWPYPYPGPNQLHRQLLHQHRMHNQRQLQERPRRFVAVPLEDVQLIREVRHAPAPPPPSPPRLHNHRHHSMHRNHQPAHGPAPAPGLGPDPPYEEPQPEATYDAEGVAYNQGNFAPEPEESRNRYERQSGGGGDDHEYVDYGAHTGHHGAFGWYADFPVISKGHR